jgi:hypothetical protein
VCNPLGSLVTWSLKRLTLTFIIIIIIIIIILYVVVQYTTFFAVEYETPVDSGTYVRQGFYGREHVYTGNSGGPELTRVRPVRLVADLVSTRRVRIVVRGYFGWPSMRIELYEGGVILSAPPSVPLSSKDKSATIRAVQLLDVGCGDYRVTLAATAGAKITLQTTAGLNALSGDGTSSIFFEAHPARAQDAIENLEVVSPTGAASVVTITAALFDGGNGKTADKRGWRVIYYEVDWPSHHFNHAKLEEFTTHVSRDFGYTAPAGIRVDDFGSISYARFVPPTTGSYTFITQSDDGTKLFIDGNLYSEQPNLQPAYDHVGPPITLTAGVPVDLELHWFEHQVICSNKLDVIGPGISRTLVPATYACRKS